MILIEDILISEEIIKGHFHCHLQKCKGACCIEGDYGAPLENSEIEIINDILNKIKPYLPSESVAKIEAEGYYTYNEETETHETALMPDGACVFMGRDELGITFCGIEKAHNEGVTDWKKPVSCHLYPIRVENNKKSGFQALNYDDWEICNSACSLGEKKQIKIYEFVKDALIRKYGQSFYEQLAAAAKRYNRIKK